MPNTSVYILEAYVSALLIVTPIVLIIWLLAELRHLLHKIVRHKSSNNIVK
jgi:hypothetical protein